MISRRSHHLLIRRREDIIFSRSLPPRWISHRRSQYLIQQSTESDRIVSYLIRRLPKISAERHSRYRSLLCRVEMKCGYVFVFFCRPTTHFPQLSQKAGSASSLSHPIVSHQPTFQHGIEGGRWSLHGMDRPCSYSFRALYSYNGCSFKVLRAKYLPASSSVTSGSTSGPAAVGGGVDAFCKISCCGRRFLTPVVHNSRSPSWNYHATMFVLLRSSRIVAGPPC